MSAINTSSSATPNAIRSSDHKVDANEIVAPSRSGQMSGRGITELTFVAKDALTGALSSFLGGCFGQALGDLLGWKSLNGVTFPPANLIGGIGGAVTTSFGHNLIFDKLGLPPFISRTALAILIGQITRLAPTASSALITVTVSGAALSATIGLVERHCFQR
jgi:hypothetical protein